MTENQMQYYNSLKVQKTPEEIKIIDYFFNVQEGCMSKKPKCTEEEFTANLNSRIKEINLVKTAIKNNAVEENEVQLIEPVILQGFEFNTLNGNKPLSKVGLDGKLRSSNYSLTCVLFSSQQIYVYKITFSLIGKHKQESTAEYFYKDITNFSQHNDTIETIKTYYNKGCLGSNVEQERVTKESNGFSIVVPGDKFYCSTSEVHNSEEIIRNMKQILREKKA